MDLLKKWMPNTFMLFFDTSMLKITLLSYKVS